MVEKPILFSTDMVKAILEGRKTMTRRLNGLKEINKVPDDYKFKGIYKVDLSLKKRRILCAQFQNKAAFILNIPFPYGTIADTLWVRETFFQYGHWAKNGISKTGKQKWKFVPDKAFTSITYTDHPPYRVEKTSYRKTGWYKRPSLFMPRAASRITL